MSYIETQCWICPACFDDHMPGRCQGPDDSAICTCGHAFNGHEHQSVAQDPERLKCNHGDGCEGFVATHKRLPDQRDEVGPGNPYRLNFWELDNHFGGAK